MFSSILNSSNISLSNGIFLKGFSVNEIIKKFKTGEYDNLDLQKFKKDLKENFLLPDFQSTKVIEKKEITSFSVTCRDNTKFKLFVLDEPDVCEWCRDKLPESPNLPVGIPLFMERKEDIYIIYFEKTFYCSFECCFAGIKMLSRNEAYSNSEYILKFLYYISTGKHDLTEAPDWKIIKKIKNLPEKTFLKKIGYIEFKNLNIVYSVS